LQRWEIVAALLGIVNVALLVRRNIWNYPFGILNVGLYTFVFFGARLYSDALLQLYYIAIQIYGWWNWYHGRNADGLARVETLSNAERLVAAAVTLGAGLILGWLFSNYTPAAAPWMDASLAAMSVTAQYLLSIRKIENWILWIAADIVYIGLYYWKGLYPTTILYAVFLLLSVFGLLEWRRVWRQGRPTNATPVIAT
jgi:nicotinamide mononucleotide transporter